MNKALCPYCGSEMKVEELLPFSGDCAYTCECVGFVAERNRYRKYPRRPLQKPLTLEEACGSEEPCVYLEQKGVIPIIAAELCYSIYGYYGENFEVEKIGVPKEIYCSDEYGTKLRCWAAKPTEEERKATKWDE